MNAQRVVAIVRRELKEIVKNRMLMLAIFLPAIILTILPLVMMAFLTSQFGQSGSNDAQDFGRVVQLMPELASWSTSEVVQFVILQQFLLFFLLMPLIIPLSIAAQSIVGEKQQRTLEPLLATPVRTGELLIGKSITAVIPAMLATWVSFIAFILLGRLLLTSDRVYFALLNPKWLFAMLLLAPLLSLLAVSIAVVLSSRVNDTRAVQQIGGMIVLPIVLLGVAQTAGVILLNASTFIIGSAIVAAVDAVILRIGVGLFQREKILTQWK